MAASEGDIIRDESERNNLQRAITDLETAIAVSNPGTRRILESSLAGVKTRVATLDKRIEEAKVERAAEAQTQAAAAAVLAAKETALSAKERETYKGFLEESYFTKKDFGKLDEFYNHSYDKLSEGGKEEMSKRIDEGIKRGEFEFSDLPKNALQKEKIHRAGRTDKVVPQTHPNEREENSVRPESTAESTTASQIDLSSVDLKGVRMAAATSEPSASAIPDASKQSVNGRS